MVAAKAEPVAADLLASEAVAIKEEDVGKRKTADDTPAAAASAAAEPVMKRTKGEKEVEEPASSAKVGASEPAAAAAASGSEIAGRAGEAAVKAEFLCAVDVSAEPVDPRDANGNGDRRDNGAAAPKKGDRRGRNKNRPQDQVPVGHRLCRAFLKDECTHGESCKFSHDVAGFLASKPPDAGDRCPVWDARGVCVSGVSCRFGKTHIDAEKGRSILRAEEDGGVDPGPYEINVMSFELHKLLQRRQYKYKCDRREFGAYMNSLLQAGDDEELKLNNNGSGPAAGRKPSAAPEENGNGAGAEASVGEAAAAPGGSCNSTAAAALAADAAGKGAATAEPIPVDVGVAAAAAEAAAAAAAAAVVAAGAAAAAAAAVSTSDNATPLQEAAVASFVPGFCDESPAAVAAAPAAPAAAAAAAEGVAVNGGEKPSKTVMDTVKPLAVAKAAAGSGKGPASVWDIREEGRAAGLLPPQEKFRPVSFKGKVYVAPLTTVGNLPFRRIMKELGADITCGEMALAKNLLQGQMSEWALLRRHPIEDVFGVQIAGAHPDQMTRVAELLENEMKVDFVDINCGCPIDLVCDSGAGSALMSKPRKLRGIVAGMTSVLSCPITVKMRIGWDWAKPSAHKHAAMVQRHAGGRVAALMVHGRSRLQRYSKRADWDYIASQVATAQTTALPRIPVIGNGDILTLTDWDEAQALSRARSEALAEAAELPDGVGASNGGASSGGGTDSLLLEDCCMLARGALIKPWLPTEIKERRHWDISSSERLDILRRFVNYGLEHWGSDQFGVNHTRRFLLEWLSFTCRYVPVGVLERVQRINERPPRYVGRDDLETLLSSQNSEDWVKISEMLLGPVPEGFSFQPKHKASSYAPRAMQSTAVAAAAVDDMPEG